MFAICFENIGGIFSIYAINMRRTSINGKLKFIAKTTTLFDSIETVTNRQWHCHFTVASLLKIELEISVWMMHLISSYHHVFNGFNEMPNTNTNYSRNGRCNQTKKLIQMPLLQKRHRPFTTLPNTVEILSIQNINCLSDGVSVAISISVWNYYVNCTLVVTLARWVYTTVIFVMLLFTVRRREHGNFDLLVWNEWFVSYDNMLKCSFHLWMSSNCTNDKYCVDVSNWCRTS